MIVATRFHYSVDVVIGATLTDEVARSMSGQLALVVRRGLLRAARTTRAWITTDGYADGVGQMVGRMVQHDAEEDGSEVVCLGLAAWDRVALHEQMERKPNGAVFRYDLAADAPAEYSVPGSRRPKCEESMSTRKRRVSSR